MKKSTLIIIIVAVMVLAVGGFFVLNKSDDTDENPSSASTSETQQTPEQQTEGLGDNTQQQPAATNPSTPASTSEVKIEDFSFGPAELTVKKGTKVTWTNKDSVQHTVTPDADSAPFTGSGLLAKGQSFSFTFNAAGTYTYHCQPHPQMIAKVVVTE